MYGGRESISYFVRRIRKSTWFTTVPVVLTTNSNPQFNQIFDANISRAGDYLLYVWLRLVTPALELDTVNNQFGANGRIRWTRNLMHNFIRELSITFNDLVEYRLDSFFLDFWAAFVMPGGKMNGYQNMIGNFNDLINPIAGSGNGITIPSQVLNLPLPICHSRDTGVSLPTAALPYNEMRFRFNLRDWTELVILDCIAGPSAGISVQAMNGDLVTTPVLNQVQVWAEYAIVSGDERKRMGKKPRDILIEQVQTVSPLSVNVQSNSTRIDIHLSHSIKALFFALLNNTNRAEWSNYTAASPYIMPNGEVMFTPALATDPIITTSLLYEGTQRLSNMGSDYYSLVQPWYKAVSIPQETGYHMYSYTLDLVAINPMGSTNYGKLTGVGVEFVPSVNAQTANASTGTVSAPNQALLTEGAGLTQTFQFFLLAVNNNIVRIAGGALGFPVL